MCHTHDPSVNPSNTPLSLLLSTIVLSPQEKVPRIDDLFPDSSFLRIDKFPQFHERLVEQGRFDLSWKMNNCGLSGLRLDCEYIPQHDQLIPIFCLRRTCPVCSKKAYKENLFLYKDLQNFIDLDISEKLRFWTFTCKHPRGIPLKPVMLKLQKAVRRWYRYTFGDQGTIGGRHGGVFTMEVGVKGGVHIHALILSRFLNISIARNLWIECLRKNNLEGHRIHVKKARGKESIAELIAYPLDPGKIKKLDENLLADIEIGLSGKRKTDFSESIPAIRRTWVTGEFFFTFKKKDHFGLCKECLEDKIYSGLIREPSFDCFKGKFYNRNFYKDHPDKFPKK